MCTMKAITWKRMLFRANFASTCCQRLRPIATLNFQSKCLFLMHSPLTIHNVNVVDSFATFICHMQRLFTPFYYLQSAPRHMYLDGIFLSFTS